MGVVSAQQEEANGHCEEEFLGWGVLVSVVYLFPHVEVIVGAGVEFEGDTSDPVEHDVRADHVGDVRERP